LRWRLLPVASREYRHAPDIHVCRTDTSIRSGRQARSRALCTQDRPASPANPAKLPFGFPCWAFCWDSSRGRIRRATRHASVLSEQSLSCVRKRDGLRIGTPRIGDADGGNDESHEENRRVFRGEPIAGGLRSREKASAIGILAATRKSHGNTMDTGRDPWKTGNRAFKSDACIFGGGKGFG